MSKMKPNSQYHNILNKTLFPVLFFTLILFFISSCGSDDSGGGSSSSGDATSDYSLPVTLENKTIEVTGPDNEIAILKYKNGIYNIDGTAYEYAYNRISDTEANVTYKTFYDSQNSFIYLSPAGNNTVKVRFNDDATSYNGIIKDEATFPGTITWSIDISNDADISYTKNPDDLSYEGAWDYYKQTIIYIWIKKSVNDKTHKGAINIKIPFTGDADTFKNSLTAGKTFTRIDPNYLSPDNCTNTIPDCFIITVQPNDTAYENGSKKSFSNFVSTTLQNYPAGSTAGTIRLTYDPSDNTMSISQFNQSGNDRYCYDTSPDARLSGCITSLSASKLIYIDRYINTP